MFHERRTHLEQTSPDCLVLSNEFDFKLHSDYELCCLNFALFVFDSTDGYLIQDVSFDIDFIQELYSFNYTEISRILVDFYENECALLNDALIQANEQRNAYYFDSSRVKEIKSDEATYPLYLTADRQKIVTIRKRQDRLRPPPTLTPEVNKKSQRHFLDTNSVPTRPNFNTDNLSIKLNINDPIRNYYKSHLIENLHENVKVSNVDFVLCFSLSNNSTLTSRSITEQFVSWMVRKLLTMNGAFKKIGASRYYRQHEHAFEPSDFIRLPNQQQSAHCLMPSATSGYSILPTILPMHLLAPIIRLKVDVSTRWVHPVNILLQMVSEYDDCTADTTGGSSFHLAPVQRFWKNRLINSTIVSLYNGKMYRVRDIRFDLCPTTNFWLRLRKQKVITDVSFVRFVSENYGGSWKASNLDQPLIEAVPDKPKEQIFLIPEFCALSGLSHQIKPDRHVMQHVHSCSRISVSDRFDIVSAAPLFLIDEGHKRLLSSNNTINDELLKEWKIELNTNPSIHRNLIIKPPRVFFGNSENSILIENGHFWKGKLPTGQLKFDFLKSTPKRFQYCVFALETDISTDVYPFLIGFHDHINRLIGGSDGFLAFPRIFPSQSVNMFEADYEKLIQELRDEADSNVDYQIVLAIIPNRLSYAKIKSITYTLNNQQNTYNSTILLSQTIRLSTVTKCFKQGNLTSASQTLMSRIFCQMCAKCNIPLWRTEDLVAWSNEQQQQVQNNSLFVVIGIDFHRFGDFAVLGIIVSFSSDGFTVNYNHCEPVSPNLLSEPGGVKNALLFALEECENRILDGLVNRSGIEFIVYFSSKKIPVEAIEENTGQYAQPTHEVICQDVAEGIDSATCLMGVKERELTFICVCSRTGSRFFLKDIMYVYIFNIIVIITQTI